MLIEVLTPLRVRLPSVEMDLDPGRPIELPDEQAKKLLARAPTDVRAVTAPIRDSEDIGGSLCRGCGRSSPTLYNLASCWRCASCVGPGARIWWETPRGRRGPALVSEVVLNSDGVWCWAENADFHGWVLARVVTRLEPGVG